MPLIEYRRLKRTDTWHWMKECSHYPDGEDLSRFLGTTRPKSGELCNECLAKEKKRRS